MGVAGAALATVISRYTECAIIVLYTHRHSGRFPFVLGLYRSFKIPLNLSKNILKKGMPLLLNEILWSMSVTTMTQIFSTRGLNIVAGLNISSTATNLFNVVFISIGAASAVIIGQTLGAKEIVKAKALVWKLIFFNVCACIIVGSVLAAAAPLISVFYKTSGDVQELAEQFIRISAVFMPFHAITHICYFTIRSGGKTVVTFFFDSVYSWLICIPIAYALAHYTSLNILLIYPLGYIADALKGILGIFIIRTGFWAQNFVSGNVDE
jgi:Na+-driven multidrug efflux pump